MPFIESQGNAFHCLKPGSKRRRTKEEIDEEKQVRQGEQERLSQANAQLHKLQRELEEAKETASKYLGAQHALEEMMSQGHLRQMADGSVKPVIEQVSQNQFHEQLYN